MSSTTGTTGAYAPTIDDGYDGVPATTRRAQDETKPAKKTTELIAYVAAVLLVVITALVVGDHDAGGSSADPFGASEALRYITYLTIGYMVARGLAKAGARTDR